MSAILQHSPTDSSPSLSQDFPAPGNRRVAFLAFLLGLVLSGAILFFAWHGGAFTMVAPAAATPQVLTARTDPRLERLLSLTESQRDCDTACLGDLRVKADKALALEQALGNLQALASEAGQKSAALEAEKAELAKQIHGLEQELAGLPSQMEKQKAELEAGFKRQITALEAEKAGLAEQISKKEAQFAETQKQQTREFEKEKAELAGMMERQKTELDSEHLKKVKALEMRLAAAESKLQATQQARLRAEPEKIVQATQPVPIQTKKPVRQKELIRPLVQDNAQQQQWNILGMTASTVVVSTSDHRVVALAAGESMDGITVHQIDLDKGVARTSAGDLSYKKN